MKSLNLVVSNDNGTIRLHPNDAFRKKSLNIMFKSYKKIWIIAATMRKDKGYDSHKWIPRPKKLSLDQQGIYLEGIKSYLIKMLNDIGVPNESDYSECEQLILQWLGGDILGRSIDYVTDIKKKIPNES